MSDIREPAESFFHACETGQGWERCKEYCHDDATFSAQAAPLADVTTLEGYTEWMKGITSVLPDCSYEVKSFAVDPDRNNVSAFAVFKGCHTGEGGPVPPTGKSTETDYVYVMEFDDGRVRHLTKVWNAAHAMKELGWA